MSGFRLVRDFEFGDAIDIDWPLKQRPRVRPARPPSLLCPNCGGRFAGDFRRIYCGRGCGAEAKAVRHARSICRYGIGVPLPEDVEYAVWIQVQWAVRGGPQMRLHSPI